MHHSLWGSGSIGLRFVWQTHPPQDSLVCSFYSSSRDFASSFLQIPPHDGHPCSWLIVPTAKPIVDFHHQVIAHAEQSGRRGRLAPVLPHHRTYRSVYGGSAELPYRKCALPACRSFFSLMPEKYSALLRYLGVPRLPHAVSLHVYMKLSAFFASLSNPSSFQNLCCSALLPPYRDTMASADFCQFIHTSLYGLSLPATQLADLLG